MLGDGDDQVLDPVKFELVFARGGPAGGYKNGPRGDYLLPGVIPHELLRSVNTAQYGRICGGEGLAPLVAASAPNPVEGIDCVAR